MRRQTFTCMLILARGERRLARFGFKGAVLSTTVCISGSSSTKVGYGSWQVRPQELLGPFCTGRELNQSYPRNHEKGSEYNRHSRPQTTPAGRKKRTSKARSAEC